MIIWTEYEENFIIMDTDNRYVRRSDRPEGQHIPNMDFIIKSHILGCFRQFDRIIKEIKKEGKK